MYKNNVELIGYLGKDAEIKTANGSGNDFTLLSIATQESWKDKETNEWQRATEWHIVLCNNGLGNYAAGLTKGTHILVEGVLRSRTYSLQIGSGKKKVDKQIRTWFIKATRIINLDRSVKDALAPDMPESRPIDQYEDDI